MLIILHGHKLPKGECHSQTGCVVFCWGGTHSASNGTDCEQHKAGQRHYVERPRLIPLVLIIQVHEVVFADAAAVVQPFQFLSPRVNFVVLGGHFYCLLGFFLLCAQSKFAEN